MQVKRGIAASPGVGIGPALVFGAGSFHVPRQYTTHDAIDTEVARFRVALENVCQELVENERLVTERIGSQCGAIFDAHLQIARDPKLIGEIEEGIRKHAYSPEFSTSSVLRGFARKLKELGNPVLAERAADIYDLEKSLLRHLLGEEREELSQLSSKVVVLASDLSPSETAGLSREFVYGFATEGGGPTSHTAILAGALEIPAVVGIGSFLKDLSGGEMVIIDGDHGEVILNPTEDCLAEYRRNAERSQSAARILLTSATKPSVTQDGVPVPVYGNIEFPGEVAHCLQREADGIGLYRTEFLYLGRKSERTEEDHYKAYKQVLDAYPESPVVIRTLDLGADKVPVSLREYYAREANPELGLRSIRVSLADQDRFKTQLRAILRAADLGDVRVMFPLISSLSELRQAKSLLKDVGEDLAEKGIPYRANLPVGMMVEVPAAALMAEEFAQEVDFFSIGTNDLIQYTLAADRSNPAVAKYYNSADPAVLRIIRLVLQASKPRSIPVTVCGQMCSDPKFVPLLVGLGVRQLSVTPQVIPQIKAIVRSLTIETAEQIAKRAFEFDLARDVESYLKSELKRLCPEME
ncbi:MAG: phosphoenolpyruvate--protein phosphotransferase [Planctomycetaceae bacterium]